MLPFVFEPGMSFERYVDYALGVPMYFVYRDGRYIDVAGASFRDFMAGQLPALPGERPTIDDWSDHLTTLFPEVRMKRFLEMRGADGGRWRRICAVAAFVDRLAVRCHGARCGLGLGQGLERAGAPGLARRGAGTALASPCTAPARLRLRARPPPSPARGWHGAPARTAKGRTRRSSSNPSRPSSRTAARPPRKCLSATKRFGAGVLIHCLLSLPFSN